MGQIFAIKLVEDHFVQIDVDSRNRTTVLINDDGTIRIQTYGKVEDLKTVDTRNRGEAVTTVSFKIGDRD